MVKWLRRMGHEVDVLTTGGFGAGDGEAERGVVRTGDLVTAGPVRRLFRRGPVAAPGVPAPPDKPAPKLLTHVLVPDSYLLSWAPMVVPALRRMVRERRPDCIITSAPSEATHLPPLALGRDRPAWLLDFRDGWTFEPYRDPFPTAAQRSLDRRLEALVVRRGDGIIAATRPIAEDFRARFEVDSVHVPNGWDPDLEATIPAPVPDGLVRFVHTGKMTSPWGRDPAPLFGALRLVLSEQPALRERVRLVMAGRLDSVDAAALARADLGDVLELPGHIERRDALALQRRADALVLITSRNASEATGKLFEYLAAGRPILALAEGNEAARVVRETGTGVTVAPEDVGAIAAAIRATISGALTREYAPHGLEAFTYPGPAQAVVEAARRAVARRAQDVAGTARLPWNG